MSKIILLPAILFLNSLAVHAGYEELPECKAYFACEKDYLNTKRRCTNGGDAVTCVANTCGRGACVRAAEIRGRELVKGMERGEQLDWVPKK